MTPRTLWRGMYRAYGLWIDARGASEPIARERVLLNWQPRARLFEIPVPTSTARRAHTRDSDGPPFWLLLWRSARTIDTHRAPGGAVCAVRHDGAVRLATGPLATTDEVCADPLPDAPRDLFYAAGGHRLEVTLGRDLELDPSTWIDVGPIAVASPEPLEAAPEAFEPAPAIRNVSRSMREVLGGPAIGSDPKAARRTAELLREGSPRPGALARFLGWLGARDRRGKRHAAPRSAGPARLNPPPVRVELPDWVARVAGRLSARGHERYLRRVARQFADGDLDRALRSAIPVGGPAGEGLRRALGPFSPRRDLRFTSGPTRRATGVGDSTIDVLTRLYRRAYQRLVAAGRIFEAAFVLAELLGEVEEAVQLLEAHAHFGQAAELAELRNLAAGLQVRQWLLAGQVERAIATARRTGAFADAVLRLERTHPRHAQALRLHWAETFARMGDFGTAVDVIWPLTSGRRLALAWARRALDLGGAVAARMLVYYGELCPADSDDVLSRARRLLADEAAHGALDRIALAETLIARARSEEAELPPLLRGLANLACRAMVRDRAAERGGLARRDCATLARIAGDPLLRADLPSIPAGRTPAPPAARELTLRPDDAGAVAIAHLAPAPGGRTWLALGELGVRLVARDGRTLRHHDVPATKLIPSDSGGSLLAVAARGTWLRVGRIDVSRQTASRWLDIPAGPHARDFDGGTWVTATAADAYGLDALAARERALWHLREQPSPVRAISRTPSRLFVVGGHDDPAHSGALQVWCYRMPELHLYRKLELHESLPALDESGAPAIEIADDELVCVEPSAEPDRLELTLTTHRGERYGVALDGDMVLTRPLVNARWIVAATRANGGTQVHVVARHSREGWMRIELSAIPDACTQLCEDLLYIGDALGRVHIIDLATGTVAARLRC